MSDDEESWDKKGIDIRYRKSLHEQDMFLFVRSLRFDDRHSNTTPIREREREGGGGRGHLHGCGKKRNGL